jgi:hypothetical protein
MVSILGFAGCLLQLLTSAYCSTEAPQMEDKKTNRQGCIPVKLYIDIHKV